MTKYTIYKHTYKCEDEKPSTTSLSADRFGNVFVIHPEGYTIPNNVLGKLLVRNGEYACFTTQEDSTSFLKAVLNAEENKLSHLMEETQRYGEIVSSATKMKDSMEEATKETAKNINVLNKILSANNNNNNKNTGKPARIVVKTVVVPVSSAESFDN